MGAFKPLLPFGRRTVAEACIQNLLEGGAASIVVVLGHRAEELRAHLAHLPLCFAVNEAEESEMGVSIARGIERVSAEAGAVLIALCDQPAVPPDIIRQLIRKWRESSAPLLIPEYDGRGGHPVLIDCRFRHELLGLDPERGLRSLFDAHRQEVRRVPVASPFVVRDMDTWDDYRALHEEVFGAGPV